MTDGNIPDLEVLLGHVFRDKSLIFNALSHSSTKSDERPSNERMEFLGDSILGTLIAESLYRQFPDADEGELTRIKSQAVSRATLERVAATMGLDRFILVGKGVKKKTIPSSLIGNLYEAIVGAIYLDAGLAATRKFVLGHLNVIVEEIVDDRAERNYKSLLQHYCQRELGAMPSYRVHREAGPAHGRSYEVAAVFKGEEVGLARAQSKKEAEQGAARAAMLYFKAIDEDPVETVRGAGTVLRVGPEGPKRRSRRGGRGRRRRADGEQAAPRTDGRSNTGDRDDGNRGQREQASRPEADRRRSESSSESSSESAMSNTESAPAHTPGREGESSRRSRRGGRRRRGRRGGAGRNNNGNNNGDGNERIDGGDTRSEARSEQGSGSPDREKAPRRSRSRRRPRSDAPAPKSDAPIAATSASKKVTKKAATKKTAKKAATKKATTKTSTSKTATSKKAITKKATTKKTVIKAGISKAATSKTGTSKTAKKKATKKTAAKKKTTKKTSKKESGE